MSDQYPRGIEVVGSAIIENAKGQILLAKSSKWSNKWVLPGGHIDPGEKIADGIMREAEEETGLKVKPIAVISWGELIGSPDFHRPAHFVYFDMYCQVVSGEFKLKLEELQVYQWLTPELALELDLGGGDSYDKTIRAFIKYKQGL